MTRPQLLKAESSTGFPNGPSIPTLTPSTPVSQSPPLPFFCPNPSLTGPLMEGRGAEWGGSWHADVCSSGARCLRSPGNARAWPGAKLEPSSPSALSGPDPASTASSPPRPPPDPTPSPAPWPHQMLSSRLADAHHADRVGRHRLVAEGGVQARAGRGSLIGLRGHGVVCLQEGLGRWWKQEGPWDSAPWL